VKFSDLNLHPGLQTALNQIGFQECTPIQEQAIPPALEGRDLAGLAQTGTGKTAAFLLPLCERILRAQDPLPAEDPLAKRAFPDWQKRNFILILVPTRELADQVLENATKLLAETSIQAVAIYGGTGYDQQKAAFKSGVEIVISTPGRLIDLYKEHIVDLRQVRGVVFDEADRMFDMGFKDDMKFLLKRMPRERQFLVFSATLNFDVLNVAYEFGAEPLEVNIDRDQPKAENVKDFIFHIGTTDKPAYLLSLIRKHQPKQAIIFSNFKHQVERITRFLNDNGLPAVGISSLMTQAQRNRVMAQFRTTQEQNILVATDLAARGLDVLGVDLVVNYELPDDAENYVHRIGRTGRAGQEGIALSLVSDRDVDALNRVEAYLQSKVEIGWMEETDLVKTFKSFPSEHSMSRPARPARPERERRPRDKRDNRRDGPGGRRPHASNRPPENRSASENRPHAEKRTPTAAHANGAQSPTRDKHRDRRLGRHHSPENGANNKNATPRVENQNRRPQQSQRPRPSRPAQHRHRRPSPNRTAAAPASLGTKVSRFFKKLFGSPSS